MGILYVVRYVIKFLLLNTFITKHLNFRVNFFVNIARKIFAIHIDNLYSIPVEFKITDTKKPFVTFIK